MGYSSRSYSGSSFGLPGFPPAIKGLLIANVAVFVLMLLARGTAIARAIFGLALVPDQVAHLYIWQLATYTFLHVGLWEVLWNMLTLWMFGFELENSWGARRFLQFYFLCGAGAGVMIVLFNFLFGNPGLPVIGAYAPIYGIILACAILWPEQPVYFIIFPMKMKYFAILVGAIALYISLAGGGATALGELTGAAFAYIWLKTRRKSRIRVRNPVESAQQGYKAWKLARAKRKFQVYLKKQRSDRDPRVN
ncbi:MAG: rhomboid family intramembrane serine protease [Bryobacteraceae bacterium]